MKGRQILFFSTQNDIKPVLEYIEKNNSIIYYEMGLFDSDCFNSFKSIFETPHVGYTKVDDWNKDLRLMIMPLAETLQIRNIPQRKGGIKYAIDPKINPSSIAIQLGGIFKENILLAGKCGTISETAFSIELFNSFSLKIKKYFIKTGTYYLGKEAQEKMKEGWRLVTTGRAGL